MNKKYITKLGVAVSIFLGLGTSCSSFLNVEPESSWTTDNFYNTEAKVDLGLAGIFSKFSSNNAFGSMLSMEMQYGTDEGYYSRGWDENWSVSLYSHVSNSVHVERSWEALYGVVNECNQMIARLDKSAFEAEEYNKYVAEARFLRAFAYELLASWWNEVPIRTTPTIDQSSNNVPVGELKDVYALIEEDFKFAIEHLPHSKDVGYEPGRPNKMAAEGLLARAYLKMAGEPMMATQYYDSAEVHLGNIIYKDGWHALNTTPDTLGYRATFLEYIGGNKYDLQESLFEITFKNNLDLGISTMGAIGNYNGLGFDLSEGNEHPTTSKAVAASPVFGLIYELEDRRRGWNVPAFQMNKAGKIISVNNVFQPQYCPGKFRRWEPISLDDVNDNTKIGEYVLLTNETSMSRNQTPINFPILRYSDVLLMYAEAANRVSSGPTAQAIECLNQVRNRAGLENIEVYDPTVIAGEDAFMNELMDERLRELCFEGLRKHDLIRWGKLGERLQYLETVMKGHPDYDPTYWAMDGYNRIFVNFNPEKHLSLPYPLQEVNINTSITQKPGW
ncbi:RagB/SusD family nutrient uptake outer membrane protein [Flammeovirga pectinis]|uniref:RagB/SusD family nutrient uptake outer membrane protein n=1 Tax=Flammeovirga pectinis TaxID=2494373 RepID=A0A3S9P9I4_9BACT|nr:RagB/SusD family nutrient uptake outer membrane protein [Flammeovirga pectinis]AZQ64803.1 RagB/SusD family nutrient uptake outer membrane protein [Flammeovirga pectinis]